MAIKSSNQITFTEHKKIVEIKEWYLATNKTSDITTDPSEGWTTTMQYIDESKQYLWNYEEVIYSIGSSDVSDPVIIGFYGKGVSGRGISNIINYYQITRNLVAPDLPSSNEASSWSDVSVIKKLSSVNKYLWNYEAIVYTDGSVTNTDPAVIGVYGDSGANAITFEIYSTHGFMFKEDLTSIELKIAAFEGSNPIYGAKFKWEFYDSDENVYIEITENIDNNGCLTVYNDKKYAFANLKCTMSYRNKIYEDYVVLTNETVIYNAVIKFPKGSNIFHAEDLYIIAYIDLYQNNHIVESPFTSVNINEQPFAEIDDNGVIQTDLVGLNGDKNYFVYKDGDMYNIALGECLDGNWHKIDCSPQYVYENDLYPGTNTNIIAISKEHVNKSKYIRFDVYRIGDQDTDKKVSITETSVNIIDANDPIVGSVEPNPAVLNQLWLDTRANPNVLKICTKINEDGSGVWTNCSKNVGGSVHTSRPDIYSTGDLWILAEGETCVNSKGTFGAGSMLKAMQDSTGEFVASHWIDADERSTELKNNVEQYFDFSTTDGLTIGQNNKEFHVNITSQKMGFSHGSNEVVHIGYNSANIDNLTAEGNFIVDEGDIIIKKTASSGTNYSFKWQVEESNGSFSLVKM